MESNGSCTYCNSEIQETYWSFDGPHFMPASCMLCKKCYCDKCDKNIIFGGFRGFDLDGDGDPNYPYLDKFLDYTPSDACSSICLLCLVNHEFSHNPDWPRSLIYTNVKYALNSFITKYYPDYEELQSDMLNCLDGIPKENFKGIEDRISCQEFQKQMKPYFDKLL